MPLLVAAATDQTGRTINMLSAGLVAVAVGLTILTIWYWRFTSPARRAVVTELEPEPEPVPQPAEEPHSEPDAVNAVEHIDQPTTVAGLRPTPTGESAAIGLDDDQWEVLTKAVMEKYLDP